MVEILLTTLFCSPCGVLIYFIVFNDRCKRYKNTNRYGKFKIKDVIDEDGYTWYIAKTKVTNFLGFPVYRFFNQWYGVNYRDYKTITINDTKYTLYKDKYVLLKFLNAKYLDYIEVCKKNKTDKENEKNRKRFYLNQFK